MTRVQSKTEYTVVSDRWRAFRMVKASLNFKYMTEHLFADFSYSIALDTYLWKQMMQMNRKLIHIWYNVDKKHLLFTKRKWHKFSWLFTASSCSPRRRSICACRIASKVLVSIGLYSFSFGFLKKRLPSWKTVCVKRDRWRSPYFRVWFSKKEPFFERTRRQVTRHTSIHACTLARTHTRTYVRTHAHTFIYKYIRKNERTDRRTDRQTDT